MLCILYVNLITACLGIAALLVERALPAAWPRRWVWCAAIAVSMTLPGVYRAHHAWDVAAASAHHGSAPMRLTLDRAWWTRTNSLDGALHPLWLTTSGAVVVWSLIGLCWVAGAIHRSRRERENQQDRTLVDGVPVLVTERLGPATVGLWRPRVVVPRWVLALPPLQRRYVLRHEEEHRRAHDAQVMFALSLTLILLPWNLALWWQLRRLHLAIEMDCDTRVVESLGDASAYGALLLTVAEAATRGPRLQPGLLGGIGMLERRLATLLAPTPVRPLQRVLLPVLALGVVTLVLMLPHPVVGR